jgi:hypothetical protein
MADLRNWSDPFGDVEALVRSAGQYVQASSDLRPKVVEAARAQARELRARRLIRRLAVAVVLVASLGGLVGQHVRSSANQDELTLLDADAHAMFSRAELHSATAGGVSWGVVEAFRELRERQSEALGAPQ